MRWPSPTPVVCLALLAGCGGEDDPPARTVDVAAGQRVRVTAEEYAFDPSALVVAGGGAPLRITLDNRGDLAHNLRVLDGERDVVGVPSFPGGEERTATLRLAAGRYRLVCTVADHEELGMDGELELQR